jgi:hypothetical protein
VVVYCRPRPLNGDEKRSPPSFWKESDTQLVYQDAAKKKAEATQTRYEFDYIFDSTASQQEARSRAIALLALALPLHPHRHRRGLGLPPGGPAAGKECAGGHPYPPLHVWQHGVWQDVHHAGAPTPLPPPPPPARALRRAASPTHRTAGQRTRRRHSQPGFGRRLQQRQQLPGQMVLLCHRHPAQPHLYPRMTEAPCRWPPQRRAYPSGGLSAALWRRALPRPRSCAPLTARPIRKVRRHPYPHRQPGRFST